jgi:hypothetical protein
MKLTKLLLTVSAIFIGFASQAQDKEVGIFLGTAQYQGDLSKDQITLNETKPAVGVLGRYYINPRVDIAAGLYLGWIAGSDANYNNDPERHRRNLSFQSVVVDLHGQIEYNLLPYISNSKHYRFAPYLFAGLSVFYFNPTDTIGGTTYDLQKYQTEGEAKYSLVQVAIPMGIGFKYSLGNFWNLGLELGLRKTFTDYLDDVSTKYPNYDNLKQSNPIAAALAFKAVGINYSSLSGTGRGNPNRDDTYIFAGFTLTKTLRRFSCKGI